MPKLTAEQMKQLSEQNIQINAKTIQDKKNILQAEIRRIRELEEKKVAERAERSKSLSNKFMEANKILTEVSSELEGSDFSKANDLNQNISWMRRFFSGIFNYFFGSKENKNTEPDFTVDLKKIIDDTNVILDESIKELGKKSDDPKAASNIRSLNNLKKSLNEGPVADIRDAFENEADKLYPGALGGDELREELSELQEMIDNISQKYQGVTSTHYLFTFQAATKVACGYTTHPYKDAKGIDFNSEEAVRNYLNERIKGLENYEFKRTGQGDAVQSEFRDELISAILGPFRNKLKALDENKRLREEGKPIKEYAKRGYMSDELASKWEDFLNKREADKIEHDMESLPAVEKLRKDMNNVCTVIKDNIKDGKSINAALKTLMYLTHIYGNREKMFNENINQALTEKEFKAGIDRFSEDSEEFLKKLDLKKLQKAAEGNNFIGILNAEVQNFNEKKNLFEKLNGERSSLYGTIQGDLNRNASAEKLKKDLQAAMHINKIIENFDKLEAEDIVSGLSFEGMRNGMESFADKTTDAVVNDMKKNLQEAVKRDDYYGVIESELGRLTKQLSKPEAVHTNTQMKL